MTLLNATVTLLEAVRHLPETRALRQAIKRMEQRLDVLQARQTKLDQRTHERRVMNFKCPACLHEPDHDTWLASILIETNAAGQRVIRFYNCSACGEPWENTDFQFPDLNHQRLSPQNETVYV